MINLKSKNSLLILAAILVVLLAGTGYYLSKNKPLEITPRDVTKLTTQSSSDDVDAIEKDLNQTDLADLDAELTDIEAEFNVPK